MTKDLRPKCQEVIYARSQQCLKTPLIFKRRFEVGLEEYNPNLCIIVSNIDCGNRCPSLLRATISLVAILFLVDFGGPPATR